MRMACVICHHYSYTAIRVTTIGNLTTDHYSSVALQHGDRCNEACVDGLMSLGTTAITWRIDLHAWHGYEYLKRMI